MERGRVLSVWICVWIIFSIDVCSAANIEIPTEIGILGNNTVTLQCRYSLDLGQSLLNINWDKMIGQTYQKIVTAQPGGNALFTDLGIQIGLIGRTTIKLDETAHFLSIEFRQVLCIDEQRYKCTLGYANTTAKEINKETTFKVEAAPLKPSSLTLNPDKTVFTENDNVTFTCNGNVGSPAGTFWWLVYHNNNVAVNKTSDALLLPPSSAAGPNSCTYLRRSQLKLMLSRGDDGIVVRCQAYHPTQTPQSSDLYRQTQTLTVQYPVRKEDLTVYSEPGGPDFLVQTFVTLKCRITSKPAATFLWKKQNSNETHSGPDWLLSNLEISDRGVYECVASNTIDGVTYNVTAEINVNVLETTTPTTTTSTTTVTTTTQEGGRTDKIIESDDQTTTIIIAVCVVIGLIIIIAAIATYIIIRKRKKKPEVEEPPEKPFNNHSNLSMYNTPPDLVSDEKKFAHNNSYDYKREQDLAYADLKFDDVPRSRRPVAFRDDDTDYAHVQMPAV